MVFPLHAHLPLAFASMTSNGLVLVGLAAYWHALRQFYGKPANLALLLTVVIAAVLGLLWFASVYPDTKMRILIVSAAWLILMGGSFFTLLKSARLETSRSHHVLTGIFGIVFLFTAVRAIYYAQLTITPGFNIIDNSSLMNLLTPLVAVVLPIIGTTAFVLMTLERMRQQTAAHAALQAAKTERRSIEKLSYIGHDLRAPLATIVGYARLLSQTETPGQADHLRAIERSASYQLGLIDEILDYAKHELKPLDLHPQSVQLADLLDDVTEHAKSLSSQQHNRFELDPRTPLPEQIHTDPNRLRQILLNLLSNAAKFTRNGLIRLTIEARPDSDTSTTLVYAVTDSGSGIEEEARDSIFNAFEQLEERPGSAGLGLHIARSIARNMGGELTLDSEPGVGSHFRVSLPTRTLSDKTFTLPSRAWEPVAEPAAAQADNTPPQSLRTTLAELAENGQLSDIESWIATQARDHPTHIDFYNEIRNALQKMDFAQIEAMVDPRLRP